MFLTIDFFGSYFESIGLAEARTDVRALRVVMIPAFATETVCCSFIINKLNLIVIIKLKS